MSQFSLITIIVTIQFSFLLGVCESQEPLSIAPFTTLDHNLGSGEVYILNTKQIQINRIVYDGRGPAALFAVGSEGTGYKQPRGDVRQDSDLTFIPDENQSCNLLRAYNGGKNITLTLPETVNMKDIRFLVMFCIAFNSNFGFIEIPRDLNISSLPPVGEDFVPVNACSVNTNGRGEEMLPGGSGPDPRTGLPGPMPGPMTGQLPGPMPSPMPSMRPMLPTSSTSVQPEALSTSSEKPRISSAGTDASEYPTPESSSPTTESASGTSNSVSSTSNASRMNLSGCGKESWSLVLIGVVYFYSLW